MKKIIVGFFACILVQASLAQSIAQYADSIARLSFKSFDQTGAVVGVWKDGAWQYQKALGVKNSKSKEPLNVNTTFQVASVSKAFTAASVGILVDRGLVSWDTKVIDVLPEFRLYDSHVTQDIKIKDLLCHRNGYITFDGDLLWYETNYSTHEILKRFAKLPPKHGFREKYGYSNIMFATAALVVEELSGISWEDFIKENIFQPLKMSNSFTHFDAFKMHSNIAHPHIEKKPDEFRNYNNAKGAVGVKTNVTDLGKWVNMWLNNGIVNGDTILKPNTVNYILNAHTAQQVSLGKKATGGYYQAAGLGWFVKSHAGLPVFEHSGGLPGLILNVCMVPTENAAVIVLTNDETYFPFAFTNEMLDHLGGKDVQDHVALYVPYSKKNIIKNRIKKPSGFGKRWFKNADLVGSYTDEYYGKAEIYVGKKGLTLHLSPTNTFKSELVWLEGGNYRIRFQDRFLPDGIVTFEANSKGEVKGFKIDLPNPDFHFQNLHFTRK